MSVEAEHRIIDRLLAPHPKIVLAGVDASAIREMLDDADAIPAGLDLVIFRPGTASSPARLHAAEESDGQFVPMPAPPSGLCVLAALSDAGRGHLDELAVWWSERRPDAAPVVLDMRACFSDSRADHSSCRSVLYRHLFNLAYQGLRDADNRLAQLNGQLYELRVEYDQARGVMRQLQDHLFRLNQSPFRLIEMLSPSNQSYPRGAAEPGSVTQPLPTSAEGLAAIDLHSPEEPPKAIGEGHLMIVLQARGAAAPLAAWRVPYDRLARGWFRCAFPVALTVLEHNLEIVVSWHTIRGKAPRLAFSPVEAFPEMWASDEGSPLGAALAHAIWGATPGARIPVSAPGWSSFAAESPRRMTFEYCLEPLDFVRLKATTTADFRYAHPLADVPGFRLHPLENKLATAVLSRACLPNSDRLLATVQVRNDKASFPVEYAMCLTEVSAWKSSFPTALENDRRVVAFSGWQTVPADNQPHFVALALDRPLTAPADLHFATRMKDGRPIAQHWADWLELRIRVRYGAVTGCELPVEQLG